MKRCVMLVLVLAGFCLSPIPSHAVADVCVHPVLAQKPTDARCTFDIWGYVFGPDGRGLANVEISNGDGFATQTDWSGFFDLFDQGPGTYNVASFVLNATHQCGTARYVDVTLIPALTDGGVRYDINMPCDGS